MAAADAPGAAHRRRRHLHVQVAATLVAGVVALGACFPAPVGAVWSTVNGGPGTVITQSIPTGPAPAAVATGRNVAVTWGQTELSGGTPAEGYLLHRYATGSSTPSTLTSCTGVITTLGCTEVDVPAGSWRYRVTAVQHGWTGPEGPLGASVTVGSATLAFTSSTTIPAAALPATLAGNITLFGSNDALTFRLDSTTGPVLTGSPATAGSTGSAAISVTIPAGTDNAPHSVFVVGTSGNAASASITIVDPPVLTALEMFDVNTNGRVDRVVATFSKLLAPYTAGTAPWTITAAPSGATLSSVSVAGSAATLMFTEGTGTATTAVGSFRIALAANSAGIRDLNGATATFASTAPTDRAAPALTTSPLMNDAVANGRVDQVTMSFSETLATYSAGTTPWTLANVPSGGTLSTVAASGTTGTLTITEGAGALDTAVGGFTLSLAAGANGIRDAAGNLTSFSNVVPSDKARPFRVSQQAFDDNGNGRFDRVLVTFSEALAAYTAGVTGWTMASPPTGATIASVTVPTGGTTATLALNEGSTVTTAVGSWRVTLTANAAGIRDTAANLSSYASIAPTDRAAPVRVSVTMQDVSGGNGVVDRVAVVFSETLTTYTAGVTPWALANVPSGSSLSAAAVSSATVNLTLATPTGPADTTVGAFTVTMTANAAGARDAAGNVSVGFGPVSPLDGAGPAPVTFTTTTTGSIVGRAQPGDVLTMTLSEPLGPDVVVPATTTITLSDPTGTGNDTITIPGLLNGARTTGSNSYVSTDATDAAFADSAFTLSGDRRAISVTVGATCAGTGCAGLGTATAAASFSALLDVSLRDSAGIVPNTTARTISVRLF